jgi:hypothetical protein
VLHERLLGLVGQQLIDASRSADVGDADGEEREPHDDPVARFHARLRTSRR